MNQTNKDTNDSRTENAASKFLEDHFSKLSSGFKINIWVYIEKDDCFSEAFLKVYESWKNSIPKRWNELQTDNDRYYFALISIRKQPLKILKRLGRAPDKMSIEDYDGAYVENQNPNPYEAVNAADAQVAARELYQYLTPVEFSVVSKIVIQGFTAEEVSQLSGSKTAMAIRQIKSRAMNKLRALLKIQKDPPIRRRDYEKQEE